MSPKVPTKSPQKTLVVLLQGAGSKSLRRQLAAMQEDEADEDEDEDFDEGGWARWPLCVWIG